MDSLEKKKMDRSPMIDGGAVTFIWKGDDVPVVLGDFNDWNPKKAGCFQGLKRGVWVFETDKIPENAYVEYAYIKNMDVAYSNEGRVADPFNEDRKTWDGLGSYNHYFWMPAARESIYLAYTPDINRGSVSCHDIETCGLVAGKKRKLCIYTPFTTNGMRIPILFVLDGSEYRARGKLVRIANNLIAKGRTRPFGMVLIDHGGQSRLREYWCNDHTVQFLSNIVLPFVECQLDKTGLLVERGRHSIMGCSVGGVMALYAALTAPDTFGNVLSQSGTFVDEWTELFSTIYAPLLKKVGYRDGVESIHPPVSEISSIYGLLNKVNLLETKIWMDVGVLETNLSRNRQLAQRLQEVGASVAVREFPGGHNYTAWRNDVEHGLISVFSLTR